MKLAIMGPPSSGKGTYSVRISEALNIPIIGTGNLLRTKVKDGSKLGKEIKDLMAEGKFISDELILEIVKERLEQNDAKNGFITDGFPRTLAQAEAAEKFAPLDLVINLELPDDILIQKALGRRSCSECGDPSYNVSDINDKERDIVMPPLNPKVEGKCDMCGGKLIQRGDDTEETIKKRLNVYRELTLPVLTFYKHKGLVKNFKVTGVPPIMVPKLLNLINSVNR